MNCDVCAEKFFDSLSGLIELTFHKIVRHGTRMNDPITNGDDYVDMVGGSRGR